MTTAPDGWAVIALYESLPGCQPPKEALRAWAHERGLEGMPFAEDEVRIQIGCGRDQLGRPQGSWIIEVASSALRKLGLDPESEGVCL